MQPPLRSIAQVSFFKDWTSRPSGAIGRVNLLNGVVAINTHIRARMENMRQIADTLANPRDAELVRAYATELAGTKAQ
jgi:hypothetical protein